MTFFDTLTTSLRQKWLQFFQVNRSWITLQMQVESVYTPDGGRRPSAYLILGVVNALAPNLAELMLPFSKLNPDADALIDVLELNFDPDLVLGNRFNLQNNIMVEVLTEIDPNELIDTSLAEMLEEVVLVESDDETVLFLDVGEADEMGDMSLDEIAEAMGLEDLDDESLEESSADEMDEMSLDEIAEAMGLKDPNDESLEETSAAKLDEEGDVLSDIWDEGISSDPEQADKQQSEHDEEIFRLFPNS